MKRYVHARLDPDDASALEQLKTTTGRSESDLVREGLRLVAANHKRQRSALDLAGHLVGWFTAGPRDLSTNPKHLEGFGE